ncbi:AraC family transcriptional regulator [Aquimarina addita]|uniref:AraC family transcriptional regulator n=1 Tax=Aquimarina addita TaxID=870485 RepID=A0ABP6UQH3_9FLAO
MGFSGDQITTDYIHRINKALYFIDTHLDSELSLAIVAEVAHYSPYHFHRVFKAVVNETLHTYITRKRIEKAASILFRRKEVSISELSFQYGFKSNSSFTRTFKKTYGISPTQFRKISPSRYSKIRQKNRKNGQEKEVFEKYICNINNHKNWIKMNATIEVKEILELKYAYINHIGINNIESSFEKLYKWANSKGFFNDPNTKIGRIFHDSFKITDQNKVRMSICTFISIPFETQGEISNSVIEKTKCLIARFKIKPEEFEKSWSSFFVWMNENGFKKAESNPFEIYLNNFNEHPENICIVDMYIPVE